MSLAATAPSRRRLRIPPDCKSGARKRCPGSNLARPTVFDPSSRYRVPQVSDSAAAATSRLGGAAAVDCDDRPPFTHSACYICKPEQMSWRTFLTKESAMSSAQTLPTVFSGSNTGWEGSLYAFPRREAAPLWLQPHPGLLLPHPQTLLR